MAVLTAIVTVSSAKAARVISANNKLAKNAMRLMALGLRAIEFDSAPSTPGVIEAGQILRFKSRRTAF